jgi:hypothetical protein
VRIKRKFYHFVYGEAKKRYRPIIKKKISSERTHQIKPKRFGTERRIFKGTTNKTNLKSYISFLCKIGFGSKISFRLTINSSFFVSDKSKMYFYLEKIQQTDLIPIGIGCFMLLVLSRYLDPFSKIRYYANFAIFILHSSTMGALLIPYMLLFSFKKVSNCYR